jgi:hypothetical protein
VRLQVSAGGLFVPLWAPLKPKVADPPGAITLLYDSLITVYGLLFFVITPCQRFVIVCPFGKLSVTVHPLVVLVPVLVTLTSAPNPTSQLLVRV